MFVGTGLALVPGKRRRPTAPASSPAYDDGDDNGPVVDLTDDDPASGNTDPSSDGSPAGAPVRA